MSSLFENVLSVGNDLVLKEDCLGSSSKCVRVYKTGRGAGGGGHAQTVVLNDARLWLLVCVGASCDWRRAGKGTQRRRAVGGWKACL